jgi:pSer/pThr/pTyr-binding forkhead associated (FHA) protein
MAARLFCRTGELAGAEFLIEREATIGTGPSNTIVLTPRTVSREHARIELDDRNQYVLHDLNSSNGTHMDNRRVHGKVPLAELHVITFAGTHDFVFQVLAAGRRSRSRETSAVKTKTKTHAPAPAPAPASQAPSEGTMFQAPGAFSVPEGLGGGDPPANPTASGTVFQAPAGLRMPSGVGDAPAASEPEEEVSTQTRFEAPAPMVVPVSLGRSDPSPAAGAPAGASRERPGSASAWQVEIAPASGSAAVSRRLTDGAYRLGRAAECDIQVDDKTISRAHALLTVKAGTLTIKDLGSANGTFVDGALIATTVEIREGMSVRFGEVAASLVRKP